MRQIVLDTETTGMPFSDGHRIIEIGCVEMINREITDNHYHQYINPQREVDEGAFRVHGISNEFLLDKPKIKDVIGDFLDYIGDSELIIHNAKFDLGFLNNELKLSKKKIIIEDKCSIIDTLVMARKQFPGARATLDALVKRFAIENFNRELHGALLDSQILAQVYLKMTVKQSTLDFSSPSTQSNLSNQSDGSELIEYNIHKVKVSDEELELHNNFFE